MEEHELIYVKDLTFNRPSAALYENHLHTMRARLAKDIVLELSKIAFIPSGEDTAGRQQHRRLTPIEVATLACDTAEAMYNMFKHRGWLVKTPDYATVKERASREKNY